MEEKKMPEVMDQEEKEFITSLILLAREIPKDNRPAFLWVGKGLSLSTANHGRSY